MRGIFRNPIEQKFKIYIDVRKLNFEEKNSPKIKIKTF